MKKFKVALVFGILMVTVAGMTMAGRIATPAEPPEGVILVSVHMAKNLIKENQVHVFDMRDAMNYFKGHIPGATSLSYEWTKKGHPRRRTGKFDISKLPENKNTGLLFHSEGPNGWQSYYASRTAKDAGYKNVMWMRDGFSTWSDRGYSVVMNNNSQGKM